MTISHSGLLFWATLYVLNNFISKRVTANSIEYSSALVSKQTSRQYVYMDGDAFCANLANLRSNLL